ncbi:ArsR/SmtB family transcription factor [Methylobacterium komagatae]
MCRALAIPPSPLSHHLNNLIANGPVTQERQATTLIYRASHGAIDFLVSYLAGLGSPTEIRPAAHQAGAPGATSPPEGPLPRSRSRNA